MTEDPAPGEPDAVRLAGVIAQRRGDTLELEGSPIEIDVDGAEAVPPGRARRFEPGEPVDLHGAVIAREFGDDGGVRAAPTASVRRVRALVIASGPDATALLDEALARRYLGAPPAPAPRDDDPGSPTQRPPLVAWGFAGFWAGAAALSALVALGGDFPAQPLLAIAIGLLACGVVSRPSRHVMPFRRGGRDDGREKDLSLVASMVMPGLFAGLALPPMTLIAIGPVFLMEIGAVLMISVQLWCVATSEHLRWPAYRRLASDAAIEGVVEATAPRLRIATAAGPIELTPDHVRWASTVIDDPDKPSTELARRVVVGGRVALVDPDGERPVLFATSRHGDPRGLAVRMIGHRRVSLLALAALDAAAIALLLVP